jgi:hypothetical protein
MIRSMIAAAIVSLAAAGCAGNGSSGTNQTPPSTTPPSTTPAPSSAAPSSTTPSAATPATPAQTSPAAAPAPSAAAPSEPPAASAAAPAEPPKPALREVTIPAGRQISVRLTTAVASDTSRTEDAVRGTIAQPIVVSGTTVVPAGAEVSGSVLEAQESGRVKGRASVAFRFDRLTVGDESHDIRTARISRVASSSTKGDLKKGGIGAGVGAVVGGIVGGGKGAAIGAGAGGAGAVLATKGNEVRLAAGTTVTTTLQQPLTLQVPVSER